MAHIIEMVRKRISQMVTDALATENSLDKSGSQLSDIFRHRLLPAEGYRFLVTK